jgi:thiamine-phosphate pyrophosphorylase
MDAPRLYLITPPISDWARYASLLDEALGACPVACVLLRAAAQDERGKEMIVRALCPVVQKHDAACLVADDPQLALRANADGVHIGAEGERLQAALRALKPDRIVGAGGLKTRHAAMVAGEAGADYVMFGGPGSDEPLSTLSERVAWWVEIFTVPCAAYAHDLDAAAALARAGADFIALCDAVFADPRGAAAALRDVAAALARAQDAAQ